MAAFRAHMNSIGQSGFLPNQYNLLAWKACRFNDENRFDLATSRWYPPAGLVQLSAFVWLRSTDQTGNYVIKVFKNGKDTFDDTGTGISAAGTFPDAVSCILPAWLDYARDGDFYELYLYTTNSNVVVDTLSPHTWFCGVSL